MQFRASAVLIMNVAKIEGYTLDLNLRSSNMTNAFQPMTKEDIAKVFDVCTRTLDNWINDGSLLPPKKLGNKVYWHPNTFYSWLERRLTAGDATNEIVPIGGALPMNEEYGRKSKSDVKPAKAEVEKWRARDQAKLDALLK